MKRCQQRESELLFQSNLIRMEGGKTPNSSKQTANDMEIPFYDYGWTFQAFQDSVLRHRSCRSRQKSCASWKRKACFCTSAWLKKEKLKSLTLLPIAPRKHDYQIMIRVVKRQKLFFPKSTSTWRRLLFHISLQFPQIISCAMAPGRQSIVQHRMGGCSLSRSIANGNVHLTIQDPLFETTILSQLDCGGADEDQICLTLGFS